MSTDYGLKCRICKQETGCDTWDYNGMGDLIRLAPLIKQLQDADTRGTLDIRTEFSWYRDEKPIAFAVDHIGHDVCVIDEYGHEYKEEDGRQVRIEP